MSVCRTSQENANLLLPYLLSCLLLIQAAIPIQAHTSWVTKSDGISALICTWRGEQEFFLDGERESPIRSDEHRTPACVFSLLLGTVVLSAALAAPFTLFQMASLAVDRVSYPTDLGRPHRQTIRAPPIG